MSYADSLPGSVLKYCRWFNASCLALTVLVCLDIFVLPSSIQHEKIASREVRYVTSKSRYSGQPHKVFLDEAFLITKNHRYSFAIAQDFNPYKADSVKLVTTPVFAFVKTGFIKYQGIEKELRHGAGMFGTLIFVPIAFGMIAAFGVLARNNKEQLLNAAVMNALLIVVQLIISGIG